VAGYVIAYAVLLITGARLGMRYRLPDRVPVGLAIFTVASLACGVAPTSQILIVVRAIQGARRGPDGAPGLQPDPAQLQRLRRGPRRSACGQRPSPWAASSARSWAACWSAPTSWGRAGDRSSWSTSRSASCSSWRLVPIPAGRPCPGARGRIDLAGLLSLAAAVLLLVVPLVLGHEQGWPAWTYASLIASVVAIVVFALIERRVERSGGAPLIAERVLFGHRACPRRWWRSSSPWPPTAASCSRSPSTSRAASTIPRSRLA
jgi:hypothetical protein